MPGPAATMTAKAPANGQMPPGIIWNATSGLGVVRDAGGGPWQPVRWCHEGCNLLRATGAPSPLLPLPTPENGVIVLEQVRALIIKVSHPSQGWVGPSPSIAA